jgi:hypothetical protein
MRTIVIGDVHGCLDELRELLLGRIKPDLGDRVIFLGDLMDRGPDPAGVVRFVRDRGYECTASNHDEKHVRWADHEARRRVWGDKNPMNFDAVRQAQHEMLLPYDIKWMRGLPAVIRFKWEGRDWIACHAGLPSDKRPEDEEMKKLVRIRYVDKTTGKYVKVGPNDKVPDDACYWSKRWKGPECVVYGHIVQKGGLARLDVGVPESGWRDSGDAIWTLGIDTGCCFGGALTAAIFEPGMAYPNTLSVSAAREYHPPMSGDLEE